MSAAFHFSAASDSTSALSGPHQQSSNFASVIDFAAAAVVVVADRFVDSCLNDAVHYWDEFASDWPFDSGSATMDCSYAVKMKVVGMITADKRSEPIEIARTHRVGES